MKIPRRELQDTAEELSQYLEIEGKTAEKGLRAELFQVFE